MKVKKLKDFLQKCNDEADLILEVSDGDTEIRSAKIEVEFPVDKESKSIVIIRGK
jgi:hypothetical protein